MIAFSPAPQPGRPRASTTTYSMSNVSQDFLRLFAFFLRYTFETWCSVTGILPSWILSQLPLEPISLLGFKRAGSLENGRSFLRGEQGPQELSYKRTIWTHLNFVLLGPGIPSPIHWWLDWPGHGSPTSGLISFQYNRGSNQVAGPRVSCPLMPYRTASFNITLLS